jgi:hypothetical protein
MSRDLTSLLFLIPFQINFHFYFPFLSKKIPISISIDGNITASIFIVSSIVAVHLILKRPADTRAVCC